MQLKKPDTIRQALAAATCGLFAAVHPSAQAESQVPPGKWEIDSALLYYSEQNRVSAVEPVVRATRQLSEDESIGFKIVIDALTGASPSGAVPSTTPQTFTSPSGDSTYTTPANEIPLDPNFRDTRVALSFDWIRPLGAERKIVYEGHASSEYDYSSIGAGITLKQDFNKRNTTLAAGLSYNADQIDPVGGLPLGLGAQPLFPAVKATTGGSESKNVLDALLGVTQVISPSTVMQFNYTYGTDSGYLTDPYKLVSVVDTNGVPVQTLHEKRPEDRTRQTLYWRALTSFGRDVLNVSYRYYWDDWGINAQTLDLRYRFDFGRRYLEPQLRYSMQTQAADFYRPFLLQGETVEFASADYRLSEMTTNTIALKYGVPLKNGEFGVRLGYMLQTGDDHPAGAPGQLTSQDLFPDTKAILFQVNYSFLW